MRLSIGNLSKTFGLSDEALRYYERKGLLTPQRDGDKGQRKYDRVDIQRISNIKRMVALGFSLAQIRQAYQGTTEDAISTLYKTQRNNLRRDIQYQIRVLEHMNLISQAFEHKDKMLMTPHRVQLETAYARVFPSIPDMWELATGEKELQVAFLHQPLISFCTFIDTKNDEPNSQKIKKGLVVFASDAAVLPISVHDYQTIHAEHAVECLFKLTNGDFDFDRIFNPVASYLEEEKLVVSDLIFTHKLFDYKDTEGNVIHYARLIVPVSAAHKN